MSLCRVLKAILHACTIISGDRWKLNLFTEGRCELYDLNADPYETDNCIDEPKCAGRVRDMTDRLQQWQVETHDELKR